MLQIVQFFWTNFACRTGALLHFRLFVPYGLDIASFWTALWPYGRDTETLWHWELLCIKLNCVVRSRTAHNTTRVFEQWSILNPAFVVRDVTDVPVAPPSPLQQAPRPTFCARLTLQRTSSLALLQDFPFQLDFDLWETFFRSPPSRILFFGRLQYHPFGTTSTRFDLRETFSGGLFLLRPYSPLQIWFVMGAHCSLFPCSIFFCVY